VHHSDQHALSSSTFTGTRRARSPCAREENPPVDPAANASGKARALQHAMKRAQRLELRAFVRTTGGHPHALARFERHTAAVRELCGNVAVDALLDETNERSERTRRGACARVQGAYCFDVLREGAP
jgi:hypothetical protein